MTDTSFYTIENGGFVEVGDPAHGIPAPMAAAGFLTSVMRSVLPVAGENGSSASEAGQRGPDKCEGERSGLNIL